MSARPIVAIDGPAGSGKSTVARAVAAALGFVYVDTGAIYRSVALAARRAGLALDDGSGIGALAERLGLRFEPGRALQQRVLLDDEDVSQAIREPPVSMAASAIAALPEVRTALLGLQRRLALAGGHGAVLEGRDIGTVVFPDAGLKVFMVASVAERARRRHAELLVAGGAPSLDEVARALEARDAHDAGRSVAPLRQADDAIALDTTALDVEQVVQRVVELARQRLGPRA